MMTNVMPVTQEYLQRSYTAWQIQVGPPTVRATSDYNIQGERQ